MNIKMKHKTTFGSPDGPKARAKKLVLIYDFYFNISKILSVMRCHTEKIIMHAATPFVIIIIEEVKNTY